MDCAVENRAVADADSELRESLAELYRCWHRLNARHFGNGLRVPWISLVSPSDPNKLGDTTKGGGPNGCTLIRIRPSLVRGTFPRMNPDSALGVRLLFAADVLLHEMVCQWLCEVGLGRDTPHQRDGPRFAHHAASIERELVPRREAVEINRARREPEDSSHRIWPHWLRPDGYYEDLWLDD